jgi:hypothetical protein
MNLAFVMRLFDYCIILNCCSNTPIIYCSAILVQNIIFDNGLCTAFENCNTPSIVVEGIMIDLFIGAILIHINATEIVINNIVLYETITPFPNCYSRSESSKPIIVHYVIAHNMVVG